MQGSGSKAAASARLAPLAPTVAETREVVDAAIEDAIRELQVGIQFLKLRRLELGMPAEGLGQ
ncbi:MAG: hypothetical protein WAN74_07755 [Thermoplasmata archaeon]